jgi:diguanylate cyclase (GGDEF)-like protein
MENLNSRHQTEFHLKSTFWLSITAATLIMPFGFYHLSHQYVGIGIGAVITALSLYLVAWLSHRKTYKTIYTFIWLTPFTTFFVAYLTNLLGITGTYWCYSTLILYYFMMSERQAWASNIIFAVVNVPLVWSLFETAEATRFTVTFTLVSVYSAIFLHIVARQYSALQKMAITDKLTGLYNRTLLNDSLEQAIHQAQRTNTPFSLIIMDVDHFKKINDELGHEVGDNVLVQLGVFIKEFLRDSDKVFRIGGEEFLILLYNTDEPNSIDIAEKIRKGIENLSLIPGRTVTVSIGVAGLGSVSDWKQWMKICDKNLYEAKNMGRNRVVVCEGQEEVYA